MKKIIYSVVALVAVLASCQKNTIEQVSSSAIQMTLTATIGSDDTKITFVDEDNVLKTEWDLYDKLSVLSLDISGNVLSNDIFTATAAGKTAEFDGTFSNDPATASVWVYYPALTEGEGTEEKPWQVPAANDYDETGVLYGVKKGACYISYSPCTQLQDPTDPLSKLEQYIVMSGVADLQGLAESKFEVNLCHRSYVLKVNVTLPTEDLVLRSLKINPYTSDGAYGVRVCGTAWSNVNDYEYFPGGWETSWMICFGDKVEAGTGTGAKLPEKEFSAYIVAHAGVSWNYVAQESQHYRLTEGDYVTAVADVFDQGEVYQCVLERKDITKTTMLDNGKMYRLSIELDAPQQP